METDRQSCIIFFNKNHQVSELTVLAPGNNCRIRLSVTYSNTRNEKSLRFVQQHQMELSIVPVLFLS